MSFSFSSPGDSRRVLATLLGRENATLHQYSMTSAQTLGCSSMAGHSESELTNQEVEPERKWQIARREEIEREKEGREKRREIDKKIEDKREKER